MVCFYCTCGIERCHAHCFIQGNTSLRYTVLNGLQHGEGRSGKRAIRNNIFICIQPMLVKPFLIFCNGICDEEQPLPHDFLCNGYRSKVHVMTVSNEACLRFRMVEDG